MSPWSCTFRCAWYKTFPIKARSTPASRHPRTPVSHPQPLGKGMTWSQRPGQAWGNRPGEESESADPSGESLWLRQEPGAACPGGSHASSVQPDTPLSSGSSHTGSAPSQVCVRRLSGVSKAPGEVLADRRGQTGVNGRCRLSAHRCMGWTAWGPPKRSLP